MRTYTYTVEAALESTKEVAIVHDGQQVATIKRVYKNGMQRFFDRFFDYRYFVRYDVEMEGHTTFTVKKLFRRGQVWFEAQDLKTNQVYAILYENMRIAIPELNIQGYNFSMKLDKEFEEWSEFSYEDQVVARWRAEYIEARDEFDIEIEVNDNSPVASIDFYAAIGQAALFIGA